MEVLDVTLGGKFKVLEVWDAIVKSPTYDTELAKECLDCTIVYRKEVEQRTERERENERLFELEKLRIQSSSTFKSTESALVLPSIDVHMPKVEFSKLLPNLCKCLSLTTRHIFAYITEKLMSSQKPINTLCPVLVTFFTKLFSTFFLAKHTPYMSTIDLMNGYHQIEVNPSGHN